MICRNIVNKVLKSCNMFEIAAFGNPLLDISVHIPDKTLLVKYKLEEDGQTDVSASNMKLLINDVSIYHSEKSPGGCAQNTLRVLQWLLKKPEASVFFGSIGNDEIGEILSKLVKQDGVATKYWIKDNFSTGSCIALVQSDKRSLIAHLGAAEVCNINDITEEIANITRSVKICYIEGYFLIKKLQVSYYLKQILSSSYSLFAFNLSGTYLCNLYPSDVVKFSQDCDILFGNQNEFKILGKIMEIHDPKTVALTLNKTYNKNKKNNPLSKYGKIIVMTNGSKSIFCVFNNGNVVEYKNPMLSLEKIRDTTGAGDAFVGGFLFGFLNDYELINCLKFASWAARQIIQQNGCTIPNFIPDLSKILAK